MAPKRGGGGSSSSGGSKSSSSSSICYMCNKPLRLYSTGVNGPIPLALMALRVIAILVILAVLVVVSRRPWLQLDGKKDRFKFRFFLASLLFSLLYLIIAIIDQGLRLAETQVTWGYMIIYIFSSLGDRASDVCVVAVILRCIQGARNSMLSGRPSKLRIIHILAILLITIFAITGWALDIRYYALILSSGVRYGTNITTAPAEVGYMAVDFLASIYMVVVVLFLAVKKAIPKAPLLFLFFIVVAYWLSSLVSLIDVTTWAYARRTVNIAEIGWARAFIAIVASMVIYILLALLSRLSNIKTKSMLTKSAVMDTHNNQNLETTQHFAKSSQPSSTFDTDTSYQNGTYHNGGNWPINNTNNVNSTYQTPAMNQNYHSSPQMNQYSDPAAQPLYPSSTYNPPQQTSHVYGNAHYQQPAPEMRYYGNNTGYAAVPQTMR